MTLTRASPYAPDLSGSVLDGRYELQTIIGEGSFGRVYRAQDRRLGRSVAVKVIKPWWAEDPEWVRAFEREARLLASVSDAGIVAIYDVGAAPEGLYLVSELVDGGSLARRLEHGPLPPAEARAIAIQLCRALARAHAGRVVHRDIKPENVLLAADGRVKVGDFGIARLAETTTDAPAGTVVGTPRYMAPEQARGGAVTPATDVYAAGVVLYEMLAGRPPFRGSSAVELALRHVNDPPPPLPASVPPTLAGIVDRALAKAPGARFADAREMARALEGAEMADPFPTPVPAARGSTTAPTAVVGRPSGLGGQGPRPAAATRIGDPRSRRRNVNPAERRQRVALLALIVLMIGGLALAASLLAVSRVRVPTLTGLTRPRAAVRLRRADLRPVFGSRHNDAAIGTVIAQRPAPRVQADSGSAVTVILSSGPPPVRIPPLTGMAGGAAEARLNGLGLRSSVTAVPAPGAATGAVVDERPTAGTRVPRGSAVALQVAATPRWRALTAFGGTGDARSVPFRIRGTHWRLSITMHYQGTCTFVFFCSGPSAQVTDLRTGKTVDSFDLGTGTDQHRLEQSGPGLYVIAVGAGSDTAGWRIAVEDRY